MTYDYKEYKTVVILASNLEVGAAMNVIGHLSLSMGSRVPVETMGREFLIDKTGIVHRGISKYPLIVTKVKMGTVRKAIHEARLNSSILLFDFPKEMLITGHDDDLNSAIESIEEEKMEYLGAILFGKREDIDKITGKYMLWK